MADVLEGEHCCRNKYAGESGEQLLGRPTDDVIELFGRVSEGAPLVPEGQVRQLTNGVEQGGPFLVCLFVF
jgi:hypothetical protein